MFGCVGLIFHETRPFKNQSTFAMDRETIEFARAQEAENATAKRQEPNLMDTGFTYMYYPAPSNFSNAAITGGPIYGGTSVVIEQLPSVPPSPLEQANDVSLLLVVALARLGVVRVGILKFANKEEL